MFASTSISRSGGHLHSARQSSTFEITCIHKRCSFLYNAIVRSTRPLHAVTEKITTPRRLRFQRTPTTPNVLTPSAALRIASSFHTLSVWQSQPYYAMKNSEGDTLRINLAKSRSFVGIRSTRCQRKFNQDRYKVMVLNPVNATIPFTPREDVPSASASKSTLVSQMDTDQRSLFYFAVFDGHGGSNTADYLTANLDRHIEECTPDIIPGVVRSLRQLGGYFRNFYPSYLKPYLTRNFDQLLSATKSSQLDDQPFNKSKESLVRSMNFSPHLNTVEEQDENAASFKAQVAKQTGEETTEQKHFKWLRRKQLTNDISCTHHHAPFESPTMARTKAGLTSSASATGGDNPKQPPIPLPPELADDNHPLPPMTLEQRLYLAFLQCDTELIQNKFRDGSTASVVLLQSKGAFWETDADLELVLGHVGDTRVLLCEAPHGQCVQLSTDHHPDATTETDRIRRLSGYVTQDSFGENMFLGRLANTRSFGDVALKPFGVSAEPEVVRRTLKATQAAFLVLISDGISSVMSNQEIVDCVKLESDPTQAATNVLNLAEQLGAEDNCTVLVVRLPAWGTPMPDLSRELREYRWQSEALVSRARRR